MTIARTKRVLLIYSRVGGGHLSAARALAEALEQTGRASTRLVDAYVECGRPPVTLFPATYARLARRFPRLWWLVYYGSNRRVDPSRVVGRFLRDGFARLVADERPDVMVSVLPVVNELLAQATAPTAARFEVVLTDWHAVHRFWVARGVDHYTAPTESARAECVRYGAPPDNVDVAGIPVRSAFSAPSAPWPARRAPLAALGLAPERFTVLAMVGAEGSPRALRNIARLARAELDGQLVVVCGRNESLRRRVARLPARMPVRVLGYREDIAELMRAADVLVTKAGGLTLAEAFCSGVPVVVHDPLPGQEWGNLAYVREQGAVAYARTPRELAQVIETLWAEPLRRAQLAQRGARLGRPHAAYEIAANLLARLEAAAER